MNSEAISDHQIPIHDVSVSRSIMQPQNNTAKTLRAAQLQAEFRESHGQIPHDFIGGNELLVNHPKIKNKHNNNLGALYENGLIYPN